jgi:metal-responsive CopG/Arc/MetJ family transcriptional regulator
MADPENRDGVAILVALKSEAQKTVRVNVALPADVLEQIDRFAERRGYTRSGFLVQAAKRVIEDEERTAA